MREYSLEGMRLGMTATAGIVATAVTVLSFTDPPAVTVGAVFIVLVVLGRLSGLYRHGDVAAALLGAIAYAMLEAPRGVDGLISWAAAVAGLAGTTIAVRYLEAGARKVEAHTRQVTEVVEELTIHDEASGLLKARYGELALEEEVRRARRTKVPLSLILLAIDPLADHPMEAPPDAEEEAAVIGAAFREATRLTDRTTRLAPGLFAAILPATEARGAAICADKLREAVISFGGRAPRCGVATFPDSAVTAETLQLEAEAALRFARDADLPVASPVMLQGLERKSS